MQSAYSTLPGELRNDVTIAIGGDGIGPDEVLIDFPMAQIQAGIGPGRITIPVNELIVCAKSDHYFFVAQAQPTSANATLHQIDLASVTYKKMTVPNGHVQILSHIHSIDPEARERDPFMLTGDGKLLVGAVYVVGFCCAVVFVVIVMTIVITTIVSRLRQRRAT